MYSFAVKDILITVWFFSHLKCLSFLALIFKIVPLYVKSGSLIVVLLGLIINCIVTFIFPETPSDSYNYGFNHFVSEYFLITSNIFSVSLSIFLIFFETLIMPKLNLYYMHVIFFRNSLITGLLAFIFCPPYSPFCSFQCGLLFVTFYLSLLS